MAIQGPSTAEDRALDALTKILESAISPDMIEAQKIILRRLALSGDLFPSRVPAPLNITEVGGYLNLLDREPELRAQVLASTLGVAGPNPPLGWEAVLPPLYFALRANDRPPGEHQAAIPVQFLVRTDFAGPLDQALAAIHDAGATLPILSVVQPLPPASGGEPPPDDLLPVLGRVLELVPSAALHDPADDPLALGAASGGALEVLARQLDAGAPNAGSVSPADWDIWTCDDTGCTQATVSSAAYLQVTPILEAAGWHQEPPAAPASATDPGGWSHWRNVTGLVGGRTRFGDELRLLYSAGAIAQSAVRERLEWSWDGSAFVAPA